MNLVEMAHLVLAASTLQPTCIPHGVKPKDAAPHWYGAMDSRMTYTQALQACHDLAAEGQRISPGAINARYLEARRDPAQQGLGRPHLPGGHLEQHVKPEVRAALPAPKPVPPAEVPGWAEARKKTRPNYDHDQKALATACPYCKARPAEPCKNGKGKPLTLGVHPSRAEAAGVSHYQPRVPADAKGTTYGGGTDGSGSQADDKGGADPGPAGGGARPAVEADGTGPAPRLPAGPERGGGDPAPTGQ